jgi:hypothetical protein
MSVDGKSRSFTLPSQITNVSGTEGWQSMYPYYTRFQPEDDQRFWFYNAMHFPEPMPAFDALTAEIPYEALGAFTTRCVTRPVSSAFEQENSLWLAMILRWKFRWRCAAARLLWLSTAASAQRTLTRIYL